MRVNGPVNGQQRIEDTKDQSEPQSCSNETKCSKHDYPNQPPYNMQDGMWDVCDEHPSQQGGSDSLKPTRKSQCQRTKTLQQKAGHENPEVDMQNTLRGHCPAGRY